MENVIMFPKPEKMSNLSEYNVACTQCDQVSFEIQMDGILICSECSYVMGSIFDLSKALKERQ